LYGEPIVVASYAAAGYSNEGGESTPPFAVCDLPANSYVPRLGGGYVPVALMVPMWPSPPFETPPTPTSSKKVSGVGGGVFDQWHRCNFEGTA